MLRQASAALAERKIWLTLAVGLCAAIFFVRTVARNADWRSDQSLWEADAQAARVLGMDAAAA